MQIHEYAQYDGLGLADLVRRREVTPRDLAEAALAAIAAVNPEIEAVIECHDERASDDYLASLPDGPFKGVPFLVKDLVLHEAGGKLEFGSRMGEGLVMPHETDLARRFRAAGVVILGRTKTPEMGFNITTENILHGPVHNPWKRGYSPGGSSGGSAAAVAAGCVPLAHANDGGGSIRIPASCCGLVGIKPTRGRTPIGPDDAEGLNGLAIEHVVSRTVRDSAAMLDAVQGAEVGDPYVITPPARPYIEETTTSPGRLRIAFFAQAWGGDAPQEDVIRGLDATVRHLADLGHEIVDRRPDLGVDWETFVGANVTVWCANMTRWIDELSALTGRPVSPDYLESATLACYAHGRGLSATDLLDALSVFNTVRRRIGAFFEDHDLLLSPTMPRPAEPHGTYDSNAPGLDALAWTQRLFNATPYTPLYNATGQPAISLPLHSTGDGLPIGMQFAAGYGREDVLFRLAGQLEQTLPWSARTPPVFAAGSAAEMKPEGPRG